MVGIIGCIICLCIYAVFIVLGFFLNKRLNNINADDIKSKITAGKITDIIFEKYNLEPVNNNLSDDYIEGIDEENIINETTENNSRFKFDKSVGDIDLSDKSTYKKEEYKCVERIDGKLNSYNINYEDRKIMLSDDICDSSTTVSAGIAAYQSISLISEFQEKTFKDGFINFITWLPKIIIQIGWLLCIVPIFGIFMMSEKMAFIISIAVFVSFLLNLLRIFKPKELAEIAVDELIEEKIINENEVEKVYDVTNALAYKEITSCFGLLRWFLVKYMGYNL